MRFALCHNGIKTIGHDHQNRRSRSRNPKSIPRQGIGHDHRNDRSRSSGIPTQKLIAGIETMHMVKKGQLCCPGSQPMSAADQFYSLAF